MVARGKQCRILTPIFQFTFGHCATPGKTKTHEHRPRSNQMICSPGVSDGNDQTFNNDPFKILCLPEKYLSKYTLINIRSSGERHCTFSMIRLQRRSHATLFYPGLRVPGRGSAHPGLIIFHPFRVIKKELKQKDYSKISRFLSMKSPSTSGRAGVGSGEVG